MISQIYYEKLFIVYTLPYKFLLLGYLFKHYIFNFITLLISINSINLNTKNACI